ncbi:hypothetical protein Glove_853g4 [Diversispora epigaea]|uniref:Uncharacterized protein n=1 Tax=Diversispora epigaea TaxID=1348612 RepID=A0A397G3A9_9GLOM|nr:hypothetical protein Glove_853g4 [Diversispora epigaea]
MRTEAEWKSEARSGGLWNNYEFKHTNPNSLWVEFTAIFNERRKREKRSPTKLYNFTSEEIGLSTVALATFYRHQKSPQRSSLDKIKNWVEKENRKKNNSVIISGSDNNSNRNNFSAELARPSSTNIILDDNNDDR